MADGRVGTESAFLIQNEYLSREGDGGWHEEGPICEEYGAHVHPRSRPPLIVWQSKQGGLTTEEWDHSQRLHPVARWEVRVTRYREDGSAATQVATIRDADTFLPIGPWSRVRTQAGVLQRQIEQAERRRG